MLYSRQTLCTEDPRGHYGPQIRSPLQLRSINGTSSNWGPQEIVSWMISIHIGGLIFHEYRILADVPYSQFHPRKGWDTVYTWESLKEHKPALTSTYGKKAIKPSLTGQADKISAKQALTGSTSSPHSALSVIGVSALSNMALTPGAGILTLRNSSSTSSSGRRFSMQLRKSATVLSFPFWYSKEKL